MFIDEEIDLLYLGAKRLNEMTKKKLASGQVLSTELEGPAPEILSEDHTTVWTGTCIDRRMPG